MSGGVLYEKKPDDVLATSFERYNGGVKIKRQYGSSTVTRFFVFRRRDADDPSKWVKVEGYGPTPGERKTDAIRKSGLLPTETPEVKEPCVPMVKVERTDYEECVARAKDIGELNSPRKIYDLLAPRLAKEDQETVLVVLLDVHTKTRGVVEVARGQRARVSVALVDILRPAIVQGASAFVLVHNHPSGKAEFSDADRELTVSVRDATKEVLHDEIKFLDHVIIGMDEYYSFTDDELVKVK